MFEFFQQVPSPIRPEVTALLIGQVAIILLMMADLGLAVLTIIFRKALMNGHAEAQRIKLELEHALDVRLRPLQDDLAKLKQSIDKLVQQ